MYFFSFINLHVGVAVRLKIRPAVNFINVQQTAFTLIDPESAKRQSSQQYIFTHSGSTSVKAVRRTLVKLSPGLDHSSYSNQHYLPCIDFPSSTQNRFLNAVYWGPLKTDVVTSHLKSEWTADKLECLYEKNWTYYNVAKLTRKKGKIMRRQKKKNLVGFYLD